MSYNYINKPKLYNTGFLLDDKKSRKIQGLLSQELTNDCFVDLNKTVPKNRYIRNRNYSLTKNSPFLNNDFYGNYSITKYNMLANPYFNNEKFPLLQPFVSYGDDFSISDNCPCTGSLNYV